MPPRDLGGPAIAISSVALVAALARTGVAAATLDGEDIRNRSIPAGKLAARSVGTFELRDSSVQARDIQAGAVGVSKLRSASVTTSKIAPSAVATSDIADGAVSRAKLAPAARVPSVVMRSSGQVTVQPNAINEVKATCQPGEVLVGGGGGPVGTAASVNLAASRPEGTNGAAAQRWQIVVENKNPATPLTIEAWALCARSS